MHSHVLEEITTTEYTTTDSGTMFDEKDMTTNWKVTGTPRTFKLWVIPFHWNLISQYLLSQILDDGGIYCWQHPPWTDPAPDLPNGGCYGYSMLRYHFKKKSGHFWPKKGGPAQPITSRSATYWLARMSFLSVA